MLARVAIVALALVRGLLIASSAGTVDEAQYLPMLVATLGIAFASRRRSG